VTSSSISAAIAALGPPSAATLATRVGEAKRFIPPGYRLQHGVLYNMSPEGPEIIIEVGEWENKEGYRINKWGEIIEDKERDAQRQALEKKQEERELQLLKRDTLRELKWLEMTRDWQTFCKKHWSLVKSRIRKGIPDSFRGKVWPMLCGADVMRKQHPHLYQELLRRQISRADDIQIRKDLPREYQNHVQFRSPIEGSREVFSKGQVAMYNVFHAWSVYNREVGYVQGMMTIGGLCLMYVTEEEAFWMLERLLHGEFRLKGIYEPGMPLSHEYVWIFEQLLRAHCPKLLKHFEKVNCQVVLYSYWFRWLTTRFSEFPKALVVRIFDAFLLEGMKIVYKVAIHLCQRLEKKLLKLDFEGIMTELRELPTAPEMVEADAIMEAALDIPITRKQLAKLSEQYHRQQALKKLKGAQQPQPARR